MEMRKVYKSGGSTYVISLPKRWAKKMGIREGGHVFVKEGEGSINISVTQPEKGSIRAIIDSKTLKSQEDLKLLIISHYLAGYDEIVVKFDSGRRLQYKKDIKDVIGFLMGLEIAEEHENHALLEVFLDEERISTTQALKRMYLNIKRMLKDAQEAIKTRDKALAQDVILREKEVDRLYFLIVRQLKSAVKYNERSEKLGLREPREALGYRIVVKSFERISDHIENLVINFLELWETELQFEELNEIMSEVIVLLEASSKAIFRKDLPPAADVIKSLRKVRARYEKASNRIFEGSLTLHEAIHYKGMLDNLSRIANYASDIAEIAVNMSVRVP